MRADSIQPSDMPCPQYQRRAALLLALALDGLGEPPARFHPVVWMGNYLSWARKAWQTKSPRQQLTEGGLYWLAGATASTGLGQLAQSLPWYAQGGLLKPLLARKALFDAVAQVASALNQNNLPEARRLLAWHLVSRDTSLLTTAEVAGAAIESLAENLSDSVVAPLLAYQVGGLPLAALYRYSNTADAMWGYRTPELEYTGKVAARADDLLNLAPARLTALALLLASGGRGLRVWQQDRYATTSPNAGHPMSAMAGALGIALDKRGVYTLNANGRTPQPSDIQQALTLARRGLWVATMLLLLWPKSRPRQT